MISMELNKHDVKRIKHNIVRLEKVVVAAEGRGMTESLVVVQNEARFEAPKDTGWMAKRINYYLRRGRHTWVGGVTCDAWYAIFVHEVLGAYHTPPTKARFLADPMLREESKVAGRIQRHVNEALKKFK